MKILAIETSCDETAIALVEARGNINPSASSGPKFRILGNLVASQIKIHRPFGGVVPNLAKREHIKNLPILYKQIFKNSKFEIRNSKQIRNQKPKIQNIDLIAVTVGPGLEPALWIGINFAKQLDAELRAACGEPRLWRGPDTEKRGKHLKLAPKLIGTSHLEGHLYSSLLTGHRLQTTAKKQKAVVRSSLAVVGFPAIALIVSGGHTSLLLMNDLTHYKKLGETRDDAVGEAFDKVARLLNLPYPGGPEIEKIAKKGNPNGVNFPRPMMYQKNYDFSFSGLKTSVLYYLKQFNNKTIQQFKYDVAASFQAAAFDVLIYKTLRAAKEFKAKSILLSGGVASNNSLKNYLKLRIKNEELRIKLVIPDKTFCTDNGAMIAAAGYINYLRKKGRRLIAKGNLGL